MIINSINGGVVFYIQDTDTKIHIDYMINTYNLVYFMQGFYAPKQIAPLVFGYFSQKTNNEDDKYDINYYNYFYSNMYRFKKHYDFKQARLVDFAENSQNVLEAGIYHTKYNQDGILQGVYRFEGLENKDIKLLAQPLHAELLNTIEVLKDTNDDLKLQNERIIESNKALVNEINAIKEAINNIATSIKTIPVVVGSPINPALITNLIVNPEDTFENQANIYEDMIGVDQEETRAKNIVKLMETTAEIKEK